MHYIEDVLKNGFEQTTIEQADDYEGKVIATLIRKRNAVDSSRAVLCVHGFNDYFFQTIIAEQFLEKGYHFYALDLRKYGRSILKNQLQNNIRDLAEYYQDIDRALEIIKEEGSEQLCLFGHSTGGLLITLYAADRKGAEQFDALICNSPFFDFNVSWIQKNTMIPFVSFLGRINPNLKLPVGFSRFYGKSLHKDAYGEWDYDLQWKPHKAPSINAGWINAIHKGHLRIATGLTIQKPILVLHAAKSVYLSKWSDKIFEGDVILNVEDIIQGTKNIVAATKMRIAFEKGIHDLVLSKKEVRKQLFASIFEWLNEIGIADKAMNGTAGKKVSS